MADLQVYTVLKSDLLQDPAFEFNHVSRQWVERILDYNVPGGKLNRGLSVIDSYRLLKQGTDLTDEETFLASALGWCVEWVGLIAVNDGVLLCNHISRILKKHFRGKPYYVDLLDLFNWVEFHTASGQMIDLITTLEEGKDLSKYTLSVHRRIVQYKTAYYSFYLTVACALLMSGENLDNHTDVKNILVEMGTYFQVQIGTDIEDYKCSWLVVKALELCNEEQKKVLHATFADYEGKSYVKLITSIEAHPSKAVQAVLKSFLGKIYKRQK